ncbi:SusD/RagB family nutrient-binding outer membrane lipoprotein [Pontibacter locisalis]|uniref:SusD/RagB family nutrient-binding outer membrane lipoprotein n=1 Tax=Pontibacter locisalis TaxID=1719035 RepID=A0ABW5IHM4_9BACT
MKKIIYLLLCASLAQGFVACDTVDFGDTNKNLNGSEVASPAGLLANSIMSYATMTGRQGLMQPTLYVQYQSQVTYVDEMLYSQVPASWYTYYVDVLNNLDQVVKFNQNEANHGPALNAQGAPENQIGVAMIMKAMVIKRVTDTYGAVPYSKAFQGLDNITPAYDTQEEIYKQLISELKAGRDMLDASKNQPTGDILYNGNVTMWKKLANSLLLQATLQLSKVDAQSSIDAAGEFRAALEHPAGVIDDVKEEAWFQYEDLTGFRNPWNANRQRDYFLAGEFIDALQGDPAATSLNPTSNTTFDARIDVIATSATKEGVPYGFADGSGKDKSQVSGNYYWNNTSSIPVMTASYTFLNRAEAAEIGWTNESAAEMLEKGIIMSFETLEAHNVKTAQEISEKAGNTKELDKIKALSEKAPAYAAARLADAATVGMRQVIGEEKWKTLFGQAFDSWAEWRRTGYPNLIPATDFQNAGMIPTRYLYPIEEANLNATNYQAGLSGLTPSKDTNTAHVWWDVD